MNSEHLSNQYFDDFGLKDQIRAVIEKIGFIIPTPIQKRAIPLAMKGQDVLGCAGTGTGKTAAFVIPIVNQLLIDPKQSAIILSPTRELAAQTAKVFESFLGITERKVFRVALLIGGESMEKQIRDLRGHPRIIVGTPGRINDHLDYRRFQPKFFKTLVLDEADRMLDMGFAPQIETIISQLPKKRQTHLYSATIPDSIRKLAASYQINPQFIDVREKDPNQNTKSIIKQSVRKLEWGKKEDQLLNELNERSGTAIVFVATKHRTDQVADYLNSYGHAVGLIHGGRSQSQRNRAIKDFRSGKIRILVATDVASRGIDIPHVAHIINFDLPQTPGDYIHRIGRTGRAGASGQATCFVLDSDISMWRAIVKLGVGAPALESAKCQPRSRSLKWQPKLRRTAKRNPWKPSKRHGSSPRGGAKICAQI